MTDVIGTVESWVRGLFDEAEQRGRTTPAELAAVEVRGYFGLMERQLDDFEASHRSWIDKLQSANKYIPFSPYGAIDRAEMAINWVKGGEDIDLPNIYDLADAISAQIAVLRQRLSMVNDKLDSYLRQPGDPDRLRAVGKAWSERVQKPISDMSEWFTKDTLLVDDAWGGRSGTNYRNYIVPQHKANAAISERAENLLQALNSLGRTLETFWVDLPNILMDANKALGTLLSSLTNMDPWGIDDAVNRFIEEQLGLIEKAYDSMKAADDAYYQANTDLTIMMNDHTAFPSGHWPVSQGLGGITGNPSDWLIDPQ